MRRHWQRAPLLVRGAFPRFEDPLDPQEIFALAASSDASSRLVRRRGRRWSLEHGPFDAKRLKQLPRRDWTLLVQDTNHFSAPAERLLAAFDFIPHARIDDVMVSYAVPGGGVGPHVDSYDVFLLQGRGRRRWQIARNGDPAFVPGLDLKILRRFVPEEEWVLEPGDMLYLPPHVAHNGVAETECLTWSIGFRAPTDAEIASAFLADLEDHLALEGQYGDPGARPSRHPGAIPRSLLDHFEKTLRRIRWTRAQARDFAGRFLSDPKPQVYFSAPRRPLPLSAFIARARSRGLELDGRTRLLFSDGRFFMNGEALAAPGAARAALARLADRRRLDAPLRGARAFWAAMHVAYTRGFVHLGRNDHGRGNDS